MACDEIPLRWRRAVALAIYMFPRAGRADFATTQIYIRTAEAVRVGFGEPFPPLPSSLFPPFGPAFGPTMAQPLGIAERDTGFEPATSSLGSWHSTN